MQTMTEKYKPLILLLKCALYRQSPDWSLFTASDIQSIKQQSEFHGVAAMIGWVLSRKTVDNALLNADQKREWKEKYYHSFKRSFFLDRELARVADALDGAHIWHVKLKGCVLAQYYPKEGMREMCDVDLLIDAAMSSQAKDVMETLGYRVDEYGISHHDVYSRPPIFCFELHTKLFMESYSDYHSYYLRCQDKLIPGTFGKYEKMFSDDDFYIFQLAHTCKHLHKSGIGLRALTDIFVMKRSLTLHRDYLDRELEKLNIAKDERYLSMLAEKLFSNPDSAEIPALSKEEENLLSFMLASGAKGTFEQLFNNRTSNDVYADTFDMRKNKKDYIKKRLFPDPETYKTAHPFFYRHRFARPALPIVRFGTSLTNHKGKVKRELQRLRRLSKGKDHKD